MNNGKNQKSKGKSLGTTASPSLLDQLQLLDRTKTVLAPGDSIYLVIGRKVYEEKITEVEKYNSVGERLISSNYILSNATYIYIKKGA